MHYIRGVVVDSEDVIKASANSLGRNGFINYFGLQVLPSSTLAPSLPPFLSLSMFYFDYNFFFFFILFLYSLERNLLHNAC